MYDSVLRVLSIVKQGRKHEFVVLTPHRLTSKQISTIKFYYKGQNLNTVHEPRTTLAEINVNKSCNHVNNLGPCL